jgi:hypothetical protein
MGLKLASLESVKRYPRLLRGKESQRQIFYAIMIIVGTGVIAGGSWIIGSTNLGIWLIIGLLAAVTSAAIVNNRKCSGCLV